MNCWEVLNCAAARRDKCPAYPNNGHDCWKVTGTQCAGGTMVKKTTAEKIKHCRACKVYTDKHANQF